MLDTSEQDLNPSYCKIQDTETVDNSNTNGSASKQNLFLGVNRIRKLLYPSHKRKRGRQKRKAVVKVRDEYKTRTISTQLWY